MEPSSSARGQSRNERYSKTEKREGEDRWFILDNAASFMPALTNATATLAFRVSATLTERIRLPALQEAMASLGPRFPYFAVELRSGFFWYYLEPLTDRTPAPVADSRYPCLNMRARRRGSLLYRVRAYGSRIAVEFCHVLTDGAGALAYLKAVIMEYYRLLGVETAEPCGILRPGETPSPEESEDSFNKYFDRGMPFPERGRKAFHIPSLPLLPGQYRVTTGIIPLADALRAAREHGATLTEFMVAVYFASLQDIFRALPAPIRRGMRPILSVEVPVNLRRIFASGTMRNFSLFVLPTLDTRLGSYDFPEIVGRVHHYMQAEVHRKGISRQIARNVGGGRNLIVRMLPLALKGLAAKWVHSHLGEDTISGSVSNLGPVELPEPLASRVERFEFIPAPRVRCKSNVNLVSWKDRLYVCFGSLASSPEMERHFFTRLAGMGLPVRLESNM
ncbi:MAG: hypothetical protein KKA67_07285 [Spirochaetes bacterium]|nr:hypothetical protein [Spirochaetota bacterium]MBU1082025.1 hypothetical protein [Spirochaetota bacterium]